jgi:DNA-binding beta-propeller fold protein YncE
MKDQRWYPTVVYLNNDQNFNGCISVAGQIVPGKFAHVPEIYDPIKQTWDKLSYDGWFYYRSILSEESSPVPMPEWPLYPSIFLLGSGYLFYTGCHTFGGFADLSPGLIEIKTDIDPTTGKPKKAYTYYPIPVTQSFRDHLPYRDQGASVLLPPAQDQKIILIGGGRQDGHMGEGFGGRAITNVDLIDLSNIPLKSNKKPYDSLEGYKKLPQFEPTMRLNYARIHLNAIILPDRTVMVCGGNKYGEDDVTGIIDQNIVEIYNPALHTPDTMSTWWQGAKAQITRAYHSLAVLLPDGSVITAGSNPDRKPYDKVPSERHPNAPDIPISVRGNNRYELETYYPPYYDYPRPSINNSPEDILYGGDMDIDTDESFEIDWAHLVRPMAVTHSMDTDQRLVDLPIKQRQLGRISVDVTHEPNLAPPGWYMLFIAKILSDTEIPRAVPSVAKWVHLSGIKYKNQFGMFGINGGQFNSPTGIAACKVLEPDEGFRIYVCDNINDRIQMFNRFIYSYMGTIGPRLSTPSSIPPSSPNYKTTKINHPISITSNSFGEIYFTNAGEHHIVRMKPNGDLLGTFGSFGTGNGQFNTPWGIAIDSSNQVYVTENGPRIQVFSRDGRYIRQFGSRGDGPGQFSLLYGIAIDKNNHIFTSDPIHQKIIKFDRNGKFISSWGGVSGSGEGQFSVPRNIAIDSLNRIYVADKFNNRVQVFDDQGNFLMKFGSYGTGKGQFNSPDGIAIDPFDTIYVADTDNHRIQVFTNLIK